MILLVIIIYIIGVVSSYYLIRLDFKQLGWTYKNVIITLIISLIFSWLTTFVGLIINWSHGNFKIFKSCEWLKKSPPKWL